MNALAIDAEINRRLEALGAKTESSKATLARETLLEALEDQIDLKVARERLAGPRKVWTLDEIERNDDLEG